MVRISSYFGLCARLPLVPFLSCASGKFLRRLKFNLPGESWLGLDALHNLTANANYTLKIILTDKNGTEFFAFWDWIKVDRVVCCI